MWRGGGGVSIVYIVFKREKLTVAVSKFLYLFIYREVGLFCFVLFCFVLFFYVKRTVVFNLKNFISSYLKCVIE